MERVIEKLRSLNEPVPISQRLPTEEEVQEIERELGISFHPDYMKYLLHASDVVFGALEPATILNRSSHKFIGDVARRAWKIGVPRDLIPIAEDNGDYYCMNSTGEVLYRSHNGATDEKWANLETWIQEVWIDENQAL
jgi:hypothetical protein